MFFDQFEFNFLWGLIGVLSMWSGSTTGENVGGNHGESGTSTGVHTGRPSNGNTLAGMSINQPQLCNFHNLCFFDQFGCTFVWGLIGVLIIMWSGSINGGNIGGNYGTSSKSPGVHTGGGSYNPALVGMSIYPPQGISCLYWGLPVCLRS